VQATTASIYSAAHHDDHDPDQDDNDYPPVDPHDEAAGSLLPPPNFRPLFTVITDPLTRETYHPAVYYVFSDDAENEREGSDVATVAALRALDQTAQKQQSYVRSSQPNEDEIDERFITVDLEPVVEPTGTALRVKHVSSLSPSWAVTSTTIRSAPTFDEQAEDSPESLMLQVEGIELGRTTSSSSEARDNAKKRKEEMERKAAQLLQDSSRRGGGGVVQGMEEIWRGLNEGLSVLEKVLGEQEQPSK
jgi:hypothetical protein